MRDEYNEQILTVSKFMDILKGLPEDMPIVIIKDASDDRDNGCYYATEVAKLHSDYEKKQNTIGLSISNNMAELLTSNFVHTIWSIKEGGKRQ